MNQALYTNYTTHQRDTETTRESEARALLSCSSKLEEVRNTDTSREELGEAIRLNQRLWTIFQVSLCEQDNTLPDETKGLLLNLSRYVDKTSFKILAEDNRTLLPSLININRTIAKGLSVDNEPKTEQQTGRTTPQNTDSNQSPSSICTSA